VAVVLGELAPQIREAALEALAASQDQDGGGKPKVKVALSLTIDLSTAPCSWVVGGGVSISYKVLGAEHRCDDPTQPSLFDTLKAGASVTISGQVVGEPLEPVVIEGKHTKKSAKWASEGNAIVSKEGAK
jgi:hypothetical protein